MTVSTHPDGSAVCRPPLATLHARYLITEQLRVPIAVVATCLFPALSLLIFVVPFGYAADPAAATVAVAQLTVFAVMSGFLFTLGVGVADDREKAWDPYVRTLPAPAWPRIAGRVLQGCAFAVLAVVPVLVVGALLTAATVEPARLLAGLAALVVGALPFLFGGLAIGYSLPVKAALPVAQLAFLPVAFAGGLLVPPMLFPGWLQVLSPLLPSRGARDLTLWALGVPPSGTALAALGVWTVGLAGVAGWAYRRDEGRRFR